MLFRVWKVIGYGITHALKFTSDNGFLIIGIETLYKLICSFEIVREVFYIPNVEKHQNIWKYIHKNMK